GRFRRARNRERHFGGELSAAEQADAVPRPAHNPRLDEHVDIALVCGIELASVDRLLHPREAHLIEALAEHVVEAALRQPPMQRHLPALEALDRNARTGLLAFDAAPAGFALARADPPADAATE